MGQQAVEIENIRREVEAGKRALMEERTQRLSEEIKRRRIESLLDNYKCRLASLRKMALSAQSHLITAESLLLAAAAEEEAKTPPLDSCTNSIELPSHFQVP